MVVRVAEQAAQERRAEVVVATDHAASRTPCVTRLRRRDDAQDHASGTDRLAEVCGARRYGPRRISSTYRATSRSSRPPSIRQGRARVSKRTAKRTSRRPRIPISERRELRDPNVVKVVLDEAGYALYFSRAPIPYARDALRKASVAMPPGLPVYPPSRHLCLPRVLSARFHAPSHPGNRASRSARAAAGARPRIRISVAITAERATPGIDTPRTSPAPDASQRGA
jgi:3-deoxy-manno-octulosonate cytidylyltransferase (CMP-KDO synthetase)